MEPATSESSAEGPVSPVVEPGASAPAYDTSLTGEHLYLEEEHTILQAVQEEDRQVGWEDISLPRGQGLLALIHIPGVVMFPGESIPLRLLNEDTRALVHILLDTPSDIGPYNRWINVQSFLRGTKTFGIIGGGSMQQGCVVELRSVGADANGEYCITIGCSRFEIVEDPDPRAAPLTRCRYINDKLPSGIPKSAFDSHGVQLSSWPRGVWRRFDPFWLSQRLTSAICASGLGLEPPPVVRSDPMALSFWVAANLPVDKSSRLLLQKAPTFHLRCKMLMRMLRDLGELRCNCCGQIVASQSDVFSLSQTGSSCGSFVNPNGYVHQMLTVKLLCPDNYITVGDPETAHSWFPGYAWTICNCSQCLSHLGWMFTATPHPLEPAMFFGIRHSALKVSRIRQPTRCRTSGEDFAIIADSDTNQILGNLQLQSNGSAAMLRAWYLAARQRLSQLAGGTFEEGHEEEGRDAVLDSSDEMDDT